MSARTNPTTEQRLERLELAVGQLGLALKQTSGWGAAQQGQPELAELVDLAAKARENALMGRGA